METRTPNRSIDPETAGLLRKATELNLAHGIEVAIYIKNKDREMCFVTKESLVPRWDDNSKITKRQLGEQDCKHSGSWLHLDADSSSPYIRSGPCSFEPDHEEIRIGSVPSSSPSIQRGSTIHFPSTPILDRVEKPSPFSPALSPLPSYQSSLASSSPAGLLSDQVDADSSQPYPQPDPHPTLLQPCSPVEKGDSFHTFQKSVPQWIESPSLLPSPFPLMPKRKLPPLSPRLNIGSRESSSGNFPSTYIPQRHPPSCTLTILEQMLESQKRAIEYTSENDRPTKKPRWIK